MGRLKWLMEFQINQNSKTMIMMLSSARPGYSRICYSQFDVDDSQIYLSTEHKLFRQKLKGLAVMSSSFIHRGTQPVRTQIKVHQMGDHYLSGYSGRMIPHFSYLVWPTAALSRPPQVLLITHTVSTEPLY